MIRFETEVGLGVPVLIANGESVEVTSFSMMSVFGQGTATLFEADGITKIADLAMRGSVAGPATFESITHWLAPRGVSVSASGTVNWTIFYSQGGA